VSTELAQSSPKRGLDDDEGKKKHFKSHRPYSHDTKAARYQQQRELQAQKDAAVTWCLAESQGVRLALAHDLGRPADERQWTRWDTHR